MATSFEESSEGISSYMDHHQSLSHIYDLSTLQDCSQDLPTSASETMTDSSPFRFLDLPPEIREKIYQYYYTSDSETFTSPSNFVTLHRAVSEFPTSLMLTCHQLYAESRHYYFSVNAFSIVIQRGKSNDQYTWFLEPEFQDNCRLIPALRLTIDRWGTASWLLNTFLPCLEDMILNGRLRELEVRLPGGLYPQNNDMTLELKRLCEDPYLEKVEVKTYDRNQLRRLRQPLFDIGEIWLTDITDQLDRGSSFRDGTEPWNCGTVVVDDLLIHALPFCYIPASYEYSSQLS